jgi:hypothetical protein
MGGLSHPTGPLLSHLFGSDWFLGHGHSSLYRINTRIWVKDDFTKVKIGHVFNWHKTHKSSLGSDIKDKGTSTFSTDLGQVRRSNGVSAHTARDEGSPEVVVLSRQLQPQVFCCVTVKVTWSKPAYL